MIYIIPISRGSQQSSWSSFVKGLASWSGDLSSLTAPSFILSPTSLTEFPGVFPHLGISTITDVALISILVEFAAISSGKTPEERAKLVLRWFILTLKCQYATRNEKMGSEKKPLNPILGETFYGSWPDTNGRGKTDLTVEQVSHHPPITAFYINNEKAGVSLEGHSGQKTSFSAPSIIVKQVGHSVLSVKLEDGSVEDYLITLPRLKIDGILYGKPYIELTELSYIVGSNGTCVTIDYKGKGWLSGKAHSYKASLTKDSTSIANLEGQWTGTTKDTKGDLNIDAQIPKEEVTVKPLEEQQIPESRLVWKDVADGIRSGNYDKAGKAKSAIENDQRAKRKDEAAENKKHELKHFNHVDSDEIYAKLIKEVSSTLPTSEDAYKIKHKRHHGYDEDDKAVFFGYFVTFKRSKRTAAVPVDQRISYDKLSVEELDPRWMIFRARNPPTAITQLETPPNTNIKALNPSKQYPTPKDWKPAPSKPFGVVADVFYDNAKATADLSSLFYMTIPKVQTKFSRDTNNDETIYRQNVVKNAFLHAWNGYKANAYGFDEIHPISGRPFTSHSSKFRKSPFNGWGATIVDNLDTLLIMGLLDEYEEARQHVNQIDFNYSHNPIVSAYDLSGDGLMLSRAIELADILIIAYNTTSAMPLSVLNPNQPSREEDYTILAESGSMILEFAKLSMITGNHKYLNVANKAQDVLFSLRSTISGLLPTHVRLDEEITQTPRSGVFTLGGLSDSYYEYLIKMYRLINAQLSRYGKQYIKALDSINDKLIIEIPSNIERFADLTISGELTSLSIGKHDDDDEILPKWEHLSCFSGGMVALGSKILNRPQDMSLASKLTKSCFEMANSTITGLAPESAIFDLSEREVTKVVRTIPPTWPRPYRYISMSSVHLGRPEIIESIFVMYRLTGEDIWRERAWRLFTSWTRHTYSKYGFSAIEDVDSDRVHKVDNMESFVLAETLKYYYLIFSDPKEISLDDYVLSTEAHPFKLAKFTPHSSLKFAPINFVSSHITHIMVLLSKILPATSLKAVSATAVAVNALAASYCIPKKEDRLYDLVGSIGFLSSLGVSLSYPAIRAKLLGLPPVALPNPLHLSAQSLIATTFVAFWSARLGIFLCKRSFQSGTDSRFENITPYPGKFAVAFAGQAMWNIAAAWPVYAINAIPAHVAIPAMGVVEMAGVAVMLSSLYMEHVADAQKTRWRNEKTDGKHKEPFIKSGLWAYSRHPNYAAEVSTWIGVSLLTMRTLASVPSVYPAYFGAVAFASPLFEYLLIRYVSGVSMQEKISDEKFAKADENTLNAWKEYKEKVPVFFPTGRHL
ncbi:hypothetical protein E3P86_00661 [Wallemia ichthyophaga]|uniref:alpha-1,2-Mannosidase n=1 Tax=Wallemia ichthyophaga TaxID=245174 RepID=A0A4T0JBZ6_WALIC|nr:hypothetical protein E3P86_00661 [Wallemia ichthyophaga]